MENLAETTVLLHGIGRTPRSLAPVERRLRQAGLRTVNLAYPSRMMGIHDLAGFVANEIDQRSLCHANHRLNFVTHSMGGLVTAYMLGKLPACFPAGSVGRVVMLGPPLLGSEVADALAGFPPYRWLYGPAGQDLATNSRLLDDVKPDYPLGIIAGSVGWPYLTGLFIPGTHDGRVSVERTRISGMTDHLVLPVMHSLMPNDHRVQNQVLTFLKTGAFDKPPISQAARDERG